MVTIIQERHIKPGKQEELKVLLRQLRLAAMNHPGYVTGETLVNVADPNHEIVIGTWRSQEDWKAWEGDKERQDIAAKMRTLLTKPPKVTVCIVFDWQKD
ncbi:MAG: antibiotic biosynthesis monooxygenase [Chloroflexi bacterium]|nr:antibiotic biosynthesis monooxygenase [Chloroflexota bacterium]